MTMRTRQVFLITFLLTCLMVAGLSEWVLRVSGKWIGRHSDTMFKIIEYDDYLGWRLKPSLSEKVSLVDVENISVRTNQDGFWDQEFSKEKPPGKCRMAFLGDSFAWGFGVHEEERFGNLVRKENEKWESLNFAVPGYGADQSLLLWRRMVRNYRPDLVVLTLYSNDYFDNLYHVRHGRQKPYFKLGEGDRLTLQNVPVGPENFWNNGIFHQVAPPYASFFSRPVQRRSRILHWLAKNSDTARLLYTLFRGLSAGSRSGSHQESSEEAPLSLRRTQTRLMGAIVDELADEVEAAGSHLLVLFAGDSSLLDKDQVEHFWQHKISFLDVTTETLERNRLGAVSPLYYSYSRHWTPKAHAIVARLLEDEIERRGWC